ncbi:MAG: T9SS type A sorting domain-containing protein, partial [Flavobacterium sp.]
STFKVKLVDFGANAAYGGGDDVEHELVFTPTLTSWNSYHIPLSDFTGLITKGHIAQLIFSGQPIGGGTLFVDNVYFSTTALSNQSFDMAKISMYPNPTSNMLTITSANKMDALSVYNVVGQEVMNVNVNADNTVLNVSGLQDGIYLVKVISEGKVSTSKFIKQ